jgi:hypothetical protein
MDTSDEVSPHYLGPMTVLCPRCGAKHWQAEKLKSSSASNPAFPNCCGSRKHPYIPSKFNNYPEAMKQLYKGEHPHTASFFERICPLNNAFSFGAIHCRKAAQPTPFDPSRPGRPVFKAQ